MLRSDNLAAPPLKWAGGKRWLTSRPYGLLPDTFNKYYEPFIGGGAMFFAVNPKSGVISDANANLIDFYRCLRDFPDQLAARMAESQKRHSKAFYYEVRETHYNDTILEAARFFYLNRACWNGLYRVNKNGAFNVPKGSKKIVYRPDEDLSIFSNALKKVEILCCDFSDSMNEIKNGDFIYLDPPYTVKHNKNPFIPLTQV